MSKVVRREKVARRATRSAASPAKPVKPKKDADIPLADVDLRDERQVERWRKTVLRQARVRIQNDFERMRKLGILDAEGNLLVRDLPPDMQPGSTTET